MKMDRNKLSKFLELFAIFAFPVFSLIGILFIVNIVPLWLWKCTYIISFLWAACILVMLFSKEGKPDTLSKKKTILFYIVTVVYFSILLFANFKTHYKF